MNNRDTAIDTAKEYLISIFKPEYRKYIRHHLAGDFACEIERAIKKETILRKEAVMHEGLLSERNRELANIKFMKFSDEECWIFMKGENNHLETVVCPVVINPKELGEIIDSRSRLFDALTRLVLMKDYKDKHGKDDNYRRDQPKCWHFARKTLTEIKQ